MRLSPPWMFALAVTVIGGAVSGASIGTAPVLKRGLDTPPYQSGHTAPYMARQTDSAALPDHYALETPHGRIEAAELALRGRMHEKTFARTVIEAAPPPADPFRQAALTERERAYYGYDTVAPAVAVPADRPRPDLTRQDTAPPGPGYAQTPALSRAEAPLALAEPAPVAEAPTPPPPANIGKARMIDVSASLANRE